jgi:hypothetical protein
MDACPTPDICVAADVCAATGLSVPTCPSAIAMIAPDAITPDLAPSKRIDEMTLADYQRGARRVLDETRF